MQLCDVELQNFRGAERARLDDCGRLNVLIGKNNSGKSTILDAISGVFETLQAGPVLNLDSKLASPTNFRRTIPEQEQLSITIFLALSIDEAQQLREEVASEAPQVKTAVAQLHDELVVSVQVQATSGRHPFAYVSELALSTTGQPRTKRPLLSISSTAADSLENISRKARTAASTAHDLRNIVQSVEPREFEMMRSERPGGGGGMTRALLSRHITSPDIVYELERLVQSASDYGEFRDNLESTARGYEDIGRRTETAVLDVPVATFSGESTTIPRYATSLLTRIGALSVLHLRDRRKQVGREEAQRLLSLKVQRGGTEQLRTIQDTVQSLMGVAIDAFQSRGVTSANTGPRRSEPAAEMDVDEVLVEMNGAGVRESLRLVLDNELIMPDLLLVEEPEVHLHPALEMSMLRYLKTASAKAQVFLTTHSTNFLDTTEMRNVYLVSREPWVEARLLDYEEAEEAIPAQLGLRLSSLFMYDRLVFVEGASDESALRELASLLGFNFGRAGVGFVTIGGARNFTHYASQSTVDFLSKRRVEMTFVLDRDEANDEEIERLRSKLSGRATLHVLQRRELENYFVAPPAVAEFIRSKRIASGIKPPDVRVQDVSQALETAAQELKPQTVERRLARSFCRPLFPSKEHLLDLSDGLPLQERVEKVRDALRDELDERTSEAVRMAEEAQAEVDAQWGSRKLEVVPGDELLDMTCQIFGVRFRKERDSARLVASMEPTDVPDELRRLLAKLVGEG